MSVKTQTLIDASKMNREKEDQSDRQLNQFSEAIVFTGSCVCARRLQGLHYVWQTLCPMYKRLFVQF